MQRTAAFAVAVLLLLAGGAYWLTTSPGSTSLSPLSAEAQTAETEIDVSGITEMTLGEEDAPITVVEYASFTCPHCAAFHAETFKELRKDYIDTGKVKFVYRDVYFDRFGLWAAMVARCGGEQKFFGIADVLYSRQRDWTAGGDPAQIAESLRKIGLTAGIDAETLDACLADGEKAQTLVAWYEKNRAADDISSTPSFVIDGEKYSNMSYADFREVLDAKLDN